LANPKAHKLKLVHTALLKQPQPVVDPTEGFEPLFLSSQSILDVYWPQASAVLQRCVDEAMHGEMTIDDIYDRLVAGQMWCLVIKNDKGELPEVSLALILELIAYPRFTVMNITAIGGRELGALRDKFWGHVCSWAYMNGVREMQASVSPAMARILKSYGFSETYRTMRKVLTEM